MYDEMEGIIYMYIILGHILSPDVILGVEFYFLYARGRGVIVGDSVVVVVDLI